MLFYEVEEEGLEDGEERSLVNINWKRGGITRYGCRWQQQDARFGEMQNIMKSSQMEGVRLLFCASHLEFLHPKTKEKMIFEIEPEGEGFRKIFF